MHALTHAQNMEGINAHLGRTNFVGHNFFLHTAYVKQRNQQKNFRAKNVKVIGKSVGIKERILIEKRPGILVTM